jgi:hypothetical protein
MATKTFYFEFEVSLLGVTPAIWRRFQIRKNCDFHELHDTIQKACGWLDYHLYEFREYTGKEPFQWGERIACSPFVEAWDPGEVIPDARQTRLDEYFPLGRDIKVLYEYDFGDSWQHLVEMKEVKQLLGRRRRFLLDGERAFPPEDCGGIPGYEECVGAARMSDTEFEQIEDEVEKDELATRKPWIGDWHPEQFDFAEVSKEFDRPVHYPEL